MLNRSWDNLPVGYWIATQFIRHDLPRLPAMSPEQTPEEPLRCSAIPLGLKIHINDIAILINSPPEIMLLAVDLYKDLIKVEGIAVASVFSLQPSGV